MDNKKIHKLHLHKQLSFVVAGISSQEQIFVVSNELNRILNITLEKLQTIVYFDGIKNRKYNAYSFFPGENGCVYSLLSNRGIEGVLFDKFRMLDYFFIISAENHPIAENGMIKKIKDSKCFLSVSHVSTDNNRDNKIFQEIITQLWE